MDSTVPVTFEVMLNRLVDVVYNNYIVDAWSFLIPPDADPDHASMVRASISGLVHEIVNQNYATLDEHAEAALSSWYYLHTHGGETTAWEGFWSSYHRTSGTAKYMTLLDIDAIIDRDFMFLDEWGLFVE